MTDATIIKQLGQLTQAVILIAQLTGQRLSKNQLADRLGCHRNTLLKRTSQADFSQACPDGKWLLSEVMEWETRH